MDLTKPPPDTETCEACVLTRMRSHPHTGIIQRGKYPLELIHTDLMGPMEVTSYSDVVGLDWTGARGSSSIESCKSNSIKMPPFV